MQDRFTRQALQALKLAKATAQSWKHSYIGTEHILAGLLKEKEGTAGRILEEFGVEEEALEQMINKLIAPSSEILVAERTPVYSPRARKLVELAVHEAENQQENEAGTEHLLLAMLKETDCVATRLLYTMGVCKSLLRSTESLLLKSFFVGICSVELSSFPNLLTSSVWKKTFMYLIFL